MAIALGKIRRVRTPTGLRCLKKFKTGKVRFVTCPTGLKGLGRKKGKRGRKKGKGRKSKKR